MSACPPEYLEILADFKEWQAGKEEETGTEESRKKAKYLRLDASRARGWAQRKRRAEESGEEL
jgi:hypothetical protein